MDRSEPSYFKDFTSEVRLYKSLIESGDIHKFRVSQDKFPFPSVKCPAGCCIFVEEAGSIPFNHLIDLLFDMSIYGGDAKYLKGARSDWIDSRRIHLGKFLVIPGIIVNDDGISVMLCKDHGKGLMQSIIHVPRHPILGDLGLPYVDTTSAAILNPNIIRAGRLSRWNSSSHVVNCLGGYTGLSTSTIAQRVDLCVTDQRLFETEFFAADHRPDVHHLLEKQYAERPNPGVSFDYCKNLFDTLYKPDDVKTSNCLMSGTVVHAEQAYSIHNQIFNRDSNENMDTDASEDHAKQCMRLLFVIVHPPDQHGSPAIDCCTDCRLDKHRMTTTLLRLFIHSTAVHSIMFDAFCSEANPYLGKLMGFVKKCVATSVRVNAAKCFRDCDEAENETENELDRIDITSNRTSESVVRLLTAMSPDNILPCSISTSDELLNLAEDYDHRTLLVYRTSSRLDRSNIPLQIGEHHLMAAFGTKDLSEFYYRWKPDFYLWKVSGSPNKQSCETTDIGIDNNKPFSFHQWQLLVYVKVTTITDLNEKLRNTLTGQEMMLCDYHNTGLAKQPITCQIPCCVQECSRNARWACLGSSTMSCEIGICLSSRKRNSER